MLVILSSLFTALIGLIASLGPVDGGAVRGAMTDEEPVPIIEARIVTVAPNIRAYGLRSSTLFVPVAQQAAFDAAAEGLADVPHSPRTYLEIELHNPGDESLVISTFSIINGFGAAMADEAGTAWRLWPVVLGEPADPEPNLFLAAGQSLRLGITMWCQLEPGRGRRIEQPTIVDPDRLPETLKCSGRQMIDRFPVETEPEGRARLQAQLQWAGAATVDLSRVPY